MDRIPLVVAATDGSPEATAAVIEAADETARRGAELEIVFVWEGSAYERYAGYGEALSEHVDRIRQEAMDVARSRQPEIGMRSSVVHDSPVAGLLEVAKRADLLVVGSRGHGAFAGILLGSVSLALASRAPCPLLVVRTRVRAGRPVVVGVVDEDSRPALERAFAEARARQVGLIAVHAWDFPEIPRALREPQGAETPYHRAQEFARRVLATVMSPLREADPQVAVEERVVQGGAGAALVSASWDAGLVVVGRHPSLHHFGPRLGHAAITLLHHAHAPLLVVPSG
ncbi:universal stress protein [Embleya scabrispora]|uniref:universal stress protein n=1 Tax=Embleya scabrispora TaxID=159449 RepID=UPI000380587F|nr:universal stress protein [Embleya scabrispora]MYS81913.1 universal stress protein [Streptomyces sp. SID5474]